MALDDLAAEQKKFLEKLGRTKKVNAQIVDENRDVKRLYEEKLRIDQEEELKRIKDLEEMNRLAIGRAVLEKRLIDERQNSRKKLIDKASEELEARAVREVDLFVKEQRRREDDAKAKDAEEVRKKQLQEEEIERSRQQQIQRKQEQKEKEKMADAIFIKHLKASYDAQVDTEKKKKEALAIRNVELRELQEQQCIKNQQRKSKEKEKELEQNRQVCISNSNLFIKRMLNDGLILSCNQIFIYR